MNPAGARWPIRWLLAWWLLACWLAAGLGCRPSPTPDRSGADPLQALSPKGDSPSELVIGVTPFSGHETEKAVAPLAAYLERELGLRVRPLVAAKYDELAGLVRDKVVHVGVFSPAAFVQAHRANLPAIPIATAAKAGSPTYLGYLMVRRGEGAAPMLETLRGKRVAWVNRSSTSGFFYPRALLRSRGFEPNGFFAAEVFSGDHPAALDKLIAGEVDVAAVASPYVDHPRPGRAEAVASTRVAAKTSRIPLDCVVLHRDLERSLGHKVLRALLDLVDHESDSRRVYDAWGIHGFAPYRAKLYDEVAEAIAAER